MLWVMDAYLSRVDCWYVSAFTETMNLLLFKFRSTKNTVVGACKIITGHVKNKSLYIGIAHINPAFSIIKLKCRSSTSNTWIY